MAVKASVDTQNQTTVRVGQQNATKVTTTQTGIASAVNADFAYTVRGGVADVTALNVSGISTISSLEGDRVVFTSTGGKLESSPSLTYSTTAGLGVSPLIDTDRIDVSGNAGIGSLNVSGISTLAGITTVTGDTLFTKQLSVSGLSTYIGVATYKSDVFVDGTLTAGAIDGGTY